MIKGNDYWAQNILDDIEKKTFNNKTYDTFKNINNNVYEDVKENALASPNRIVIVDEKKGPYTYNDLLELTDAFSYYLFEELNIKRGKHIGLLLNNSIEFIVSFLSAQKLGAVIVPIPTKYRKPEIHSLIQKSDCDLLIVAKEYDSIIEKCNEENKIEVLFCDSESLESYRRSYSEDKKRKSEKLTVGTAEDVGIIMFTSGTTGHSKGVVIRNFNIQHAVMSYIKILNISSEDSTVLSIPMYNVTGLVATLSVFLKCKGVIYLHKYFDAEQLLEDIRRFNITFLHASPTIFNLMLQLKDEFPNLPSMKTLACGSSNMPINTIKLLKEWMPGMSFRTIYGLSETTSPGTIFPSDAATSPFIGSSGVPIPGLSIKIVDEFEKELGANEIGEIYLKGTNVIEEYYKQDHGLITEDNWLKSGDLGYLNDEGYLFVVDRKDDIINRGGEKIFTTDLENLIHDIEGINEVAVIGVPNEIYGEVPVAVISLQKGYAIDSSMIKSELTKKIASYKIPTEYYFVKEIIKTANNKIDKKKLKRKLTVKVNS